MTSIDNKYYIYLLIVLLLFPALLINLGLMPLSADEATRALVALEMKFSGNIITPTINGEYYFNKPPLYNWLLLGLFKLTGNASEWIIRIPVVFFLLFFGVSIYLGTRKKIGEKVSIISALAFISCGRILFYDSMLGLIDTSFSLLIFLNFLLIYELLRKEKYLNLFLFSYLIAAAGFLMKGLPAIVFQGITILAALFFFKQQRRIISFQHLLGILVFLLITGSYYFMVWMENPTGEYFQTLLSESTKRTFLEYGLWNTILHLFTFPVEQLYHLLPWSVLFIYLFERKFYQNLRKSKFLSFLSLVFLLNITVYWLSPETYPRYLFMLYPILLILLVNHHFQLKEQENRLSGIVEQIYLGMLILVVPAILAGIYLYPFEYERSFVFPVLFLAISILIVLVLFRKIKPYRLELLIMALLVLRIGFNWIVIPERLAASRETDQRTLAYQVAELTRDQPLLLDTFTGISHETSFYISKERGEILNIKKQEMQPGSFYIVSDKIPVGPREEIILRFETRWINRPLRLVKYSNIPVESY